MPNGERVVARMHGMIDGKVSVILPDGQLGFSSGLAYTDEPFRPEMAERIRDTLCAGPFANFQVLQSPHYVILYQSTTRFAEASLKLLEDLYQNLFEALRKRNVPVHEAEFPLVAIIFRTERDFRVYQQVDPDVQAYYEIFTNRIYFAQKSDRDQQAPEVAALRKPQTVAHEGTHQILQNIGVQPRLGDWPLWLVEGLAEYCSPPTSTRSGTAWGGLGRVNAMHMATLRDLEDPLSLHVRGGSVPRHFGGHSKVPLVEYLVTRTELSPTDYALIWAMTHYLALKRGNEFLTFLKAMSRTPPLQKRTPADHLAAFREAFGPDLVKMDKAIATHLSKLRYDPLPYYAVLFEQRVVGGMIKRAALVSQSPSMIRQWLEEVRSPQGDDPAWQTLPHPNRARALLAADEWLRAH